MFRLINKSSLKTFSLLFKTNRFLFTKKDNKGSFFKNKEFKK